MGRSNSFVEDFRTVAEGQAALFKQVNAAITTAIYTTKDSTTLVASGITESNIPLLKFLTISPVILPARLALSNVVVRIDYNGQPLFQEVTGVVQALNSGLVRGNVLSVVSDSTTYLPFQNGVGPSNLPYSTVVNNATSATFGLVPTTGYALTSAFTLIYTNGEYRGSTNLYDNSSPPPPGAGSPLR
jgi:hypothetical protein